MDALAAATPELQSGAALGPYTALGATVGGPLVRPVATVHVAVTRPQAWDTGGAVTPEGGGAAGDGGAGQLITAVVTVRLIVTHKRGRDALARPAPEL